MKIVVDTNVLISGVFFGGAPSRVVDACITGDPLLVVSPEILDEYRRVGLEFTRRKVNVDFERFLTLLLTAAAVVAPAPLHEPVCRDPDDDKFLACALAGRAIIVVEKSAPRLV